MPELPPGKLEYMKPLERFANINVLSSRILDIHLFVGCEDMKQNGNFKLLIPLEINKIISVLIC